MDMVPDVLTALRAHPRCVVIVEYGLGFVRNLCRVDENKVCCCGNDRPASDSELGSKRICIPHSAHYV